MEWSVANIDMAPTMNQVGATPALELRARPINQNRLANFFSRPGILIRVVLYLTILTYLPAVLFDFAYDDVQLILLNPWMMSWKGVQMFFTRSFWAFADFPRPTDYYRPLVMTFLAAIRHVLGPAPAWFHLMVIGVHVAAVYLVYRVARELTGDATMAVIAAAIFGLHPTKIESVVWISGVSDSLCLVFFLASILMYLRWKTSGMRGHVPVSSLALLLLAVLSKEMAVVVPVLIAVYELLTRSGALRERIKSTARVVAPYVAVVVAVLTIRVHAMRDFVGMPGYDFHYGYSFYTAPQAVIWYLTKQLWPLPVSIQYRILAVTQPTFFQFMVPLAALLLPAVALAHFLRRSPAGWFLFAWFVLTLAPVLVFGSLLQLHDRHMYAPSVATSIALAHLIVTFVRDRTHSGIPLRTPLVLTACVLLAAITAGEERYWSDDIRLFTRAIAVAPDHGDAYAALVTAYFSIHDIDNADRVAKLWVANAIDSAAGWSALAEVRRERNDYAGARAALHQALRCAKTKYGEVVPAMGLGWLAQSEGKTSEAVYWYGLAVAGQPSVAMLHDMYGRVLLQDGKPSDGERELQIAQRLRNRNGL